MENNRTDLLIFLNELATIHRNLPARESLCYDMHKNTLVLWDHINGILYTNVKVPEYKCTPTEIKLAYQQFFVDNNKSFEFIFLHGIFFHPGEVEGTIVFGKNYYAINGHPDAIKDARVLNLYKKNAYPTKKEIFYQ